jgi:hypothetical protein
MLRPTDLCQEKLAQDAGYGLSEVLGKNESPTAVMALKENKSGKPTKKKAVLLRHLPCRT